MDSFKYLQVDRTEDDYRAELIAIEYEKRVLPVVGTIESSLFGTLSDLQEKDQLALDMAEIFSWDIDFNTEIQRGDHFRLMVEKLYLDDRLVRYGDILAVEFHNSGKLFTGYRFEDPEGEAGYFDGMAGRSLKRDFLRSPVKFSPHQLAIFLQEASSRSEKTTAAPRSGLRGAYRYSGCGCRQRPSTVPRMEGRLWQPG